MLNSNVREIFKEKPFEPVINLHSGDIFLSQPYFVVPLHKRNDLKRIHVQ
jgi:hypothetical protein